MLPSPVKLEDTTLALLLSRWKSLIDPAIDSLTATPILLPQISLTSGFNQIDHKLARPLIGWLVVRMRSNFIQVYDMQDANPLPDKTLWLHANGSAVVDLLVF